MEGDGLIQSSSIFDTLADQLAVLLAMLSRPVVQRQIVTVLLILLVSWVIPEAARRWRRRRKSADERIEVEIAESGETEHGRSRWLLALFHLLTPILAIVLLEITVWLFNQQGYPSGLLDDFANLIWYWLIYRALLSLLYARYGEAVRPYRNRIITPVFVLLIILQLMATLPGSVTLTEVTLDIGVASFNLGSLLSALIVLYIFIVVAWVVEQIMVRSLANRLDAEPGVIESFATLTRYALLSLGIIVFLGMIGLDFTSLAIIAGGLSVGIGIGLQDIVSNFVSGLVLLFEQALKPGDVVELDGLISQVEKISLRATIVRTLTNEELIVPNASFTTNQVKNLTRSDRLVRVVVPFGVSYKSKPELVRQLAEDTGGQHPLVLAEPPPKLLFCGYGESSINFELRASIDHPEMTLHIKSDLYYMLWDALREHNVTIPYPQRDLNLGDGWEKVASELGRE